MRHPITLLIFLVGLVMSACGGGATGDVNVSVDMSALTSADIGSVSVTVTGPGMTDMQTQLVLVGSTWQGTLGGIPVGGDRVFSGVASDAGGNPIFQGQSAPVTILAGQTALVILELTPITPPPAFGNHAPHIDSLYVSAQAVAPGATLQLAATASDLDGDPLMVAWTGAGAFASPATVATTWTAPATDGAYPLTVTVTDPHGAFDAVTVTIQVSVASARGAAEINATFNAYPQVQDVTLATGHLQPGATATATATAFDADGDPLTYAWSDDCGGTWSGASTTADFTLPASSTATQCTLRVEVDDGHGGTNFGTLVVAVGGATTTVGPLVDQTFQSTSTVDNDGVVVLRASGHDVGGGPIEFGWTASTGAIGARTDTAGDTVVDWQAPDCFTGSAEITVTVIAASGEQASHTFRVAAASPAQVCGCVKLFTNPARIQTMQISGSNLLYSAGQEEFDVFTGGSSTTFNSINIAPYDIPAPWFDGGNRVFYSLNYEPGTGSVFAVNPDGTGNTLLSANEAYQGGMTSDGTYVYWTRSYPGLYAIRRVPVGGGTVETLANAGVEPRGIVLVGNTLYWAAHGDDAIYAMPAAGGTPVAVVTAVGGPEQVVTDGHTVFFANDAGVIRRYDPATQNTTPVYIALAPYYTLAADHAHVYGVHPTGEVDEITFGGGGLSTLANVPGAFGLTVDDTYVYIGSQTSGDVWRCIH